MTCPTCHNCIPVSLYVDGTYYPNMCVSKRAEIVTNGYPLSSVADFDRRRQYEEHAQDTVQPYNAIGPNSEFYRLYPKQAEKIFTADELEQVKSKL